MNSRSFLGGLTDRLKRSLSVLLGVCLIAPAIIGSPSITIAADRTPHPASDAVKIELTPSLVVVQPLGKVSYIANGYDKDGNLVDFGPNDLDWRALNRVGTILKTGNNTAVLTAATRANVYQNSVLVRSLVNGVSAYGTVLITAQPAPTYYRLEMISGNNQTGVAGQPLNNPFVVRVTDFYGNPIQNFKVDWNASGIHPYGSYGSPVFHTDYTDASGLARLNFTLGTKTGEYGVTANANHIYKNGNATYIYPLYGSPQVFHAVAVPGVVAKVSITYPKSSMSVKAGQSLKCYAEARDALDNLITGEARNFTWINADPDGIFHKSAVGIYPVSASYKGTTSVPVSITVVTNVLDHVTITPHNATIETTMGEMYEFNAYDVENNLIDKSTLTYNWTATGGWLMNPQAVETLYIAGIVSGKYNVYLDVTQGDITKSDTANITVNDLPLHHFDVYVNDPDIDKIVGVQFTIQVIAKDMNNNVITSFQDIAGLSDTTGTITPGFTDNFNGGMWIHTVTINQAIMGDNIYAINGLRDGNSSAFNVVAL